MARILIADDDPDFRAGLVETIADAGHLPIEAETGPLALRAFERERFDAAILDLRMPGMSGLEVLEAARQRRLMPGAPVIVLTGFADSANTIEAMRLGAFDHLTKPVGRHALLECLAAALETADVDASKTPPDPADGATVVAGDMIGNSVAMRDVQKRIGLASRADASVLVTGETGTGKEVVARLLHRHSDRRNGPFVAINCTAIPADLLESELFGHVRGAFSGAVADRAGSFEQANGGVLFLDEIGDMPLPMQAKLLRVLQERTFMPVGGSTLKRADVRIVAATHQDLGRAVAERRFRADLRFRLDVLRIHLPALRDRGDDVVPLACHFLKLLGSGKQLTMAAGQSLMQYSWPGNVRELRNVMERAAVAARGESIDLADIEPIGDAIPGADRTQNAAASALWEGLSLPEAVDKLERLMIEEALAKAHGNRAEAARLLGIRRQLLYTKLVAHKLEDR